MKKIIGVLFLVLISSCSFLSVIQKNCITEIEKSANGNFIFCAMCDSITALELFKQVKNDTTNRQ